MKRTKSFRGQHGTVSSITTSATEERRSTSSRKRSKEYNVIVLLLSQLYCLKTSSGFRLLEKKQQNCDFTKKYMLF